MYEVKFENIFLTLNKKDILKNINIEIEPESSFSILGPSGDGKTSLFKLLTGEFTPTSGNVFIKERIVNSVPMQHRNAIIVSAEDSLFHHMTVKENITFVPKVKKMGKDYIENTTEKLLSILGMSGYEKYYPRELSTGQKQRIAIARALALQPSILMLDEAFSNLDKSLRREMTELISTVVRKETKVTLLSISHNLEEAIYLGDNTGVMLNGELHYAENFEQLLKKSEKVREFIGNVQVVDGFIKDNYFISDNICIPYVGKSRKAKAVVGEYFFVYPEM